MRNVKAQTAIAVLFLVTLLPGFIRASHSMGADLTYKCTGPNTYLVRLAFYRDCAGIPANSTYNIVASTISCNQNVSFFVNLVAGYPVEVSQLCPAQLVNSTCNGGALPGVQQYVYENTVTLPSACPDWIFNFTNCCRNNNVSTLVNPDLQNLSLQARLNNLAAPDNNSPEFTTNPVPYLCMGQSYIFNHGARDRDGDSLVFSLVNAMHNIITQVTYSPGYNGINPMSSVPGVSINSVNGNLTFNPNQLQVAVVAVRVEEYRNGILIGSVVRDMQVTVLNCSNTPPVIQPVTALSGGTATGSYDVTVCAGTTVNFTLPVTDADAGQTVTRSWNNSISGATFNPSTGVFSWSPNGEDAGTHIFIITATDNACPQTSQSSRAITVRVEPGTTVGPDRNYCSTAGPVLLEATGGTAFTWNILSGTPGSLSCTNCPSPVASPVLTSVYEVQGNLSGACRTRDTVTVNPVPGFNLSMVPSQTICAGTPVNLSATPSAPGIYTYSWNNGGTLSSTTVSNPLATPTTSANYTVTVTSAAGCIMTATTTLTVPNYSLVTSPAASPAIICGSQTSTLNANATGNACGGYSLSPVAIATTVGGGWTTVTPGNDGLTAAIPLGFSFPYFCNTYTDFYISSNGFITFTNGGNSGCCSGQYIPEASAPNNLIALAWADLNPAAGGSIRYKVTGTTPNRKMVIHYNGVPHASGPGLVDGQIHLYETSGVIEFHLTTMTTNNSPHTMGIENSAGTVAYVVAGRNAAYNWSAASEGWRFTPNTTPGITITWQAPLGNTIGTGPSIVVSPGSTTVYYVIISDGICSVTQNITVTNNCPLATELISFHATPVENQIKLNWATATEEALNYIELERSDDGTRFENMGQFAANGIASAYESTDENPLAGANYYRLRLVNEDGDFTYSEIIRADFSPAGKVLLYPNPTADFLNVDFTTGEHSAATLEIFSADGRQVLSRNWDSLTEETLKVQIGLETYPAGIYYLRAGTGVSQTVHKFEILR